MTSIKHTTAQRIALNTYLSDYDTGLSFDDILEDMAKAEPQNDSTVVAEYYEDWNSEALAVEIKSLEESIRREYGLYEPSDNTL